MSITVRITVMRQEKGLDQWKSHQFRIVDDMIHTRLDLCLAVNKYSKTRLIQFASFVTFSSVPAEFLSFAYISVRLIRHLFLSLRSILFG